MGRGRIADGHRKLTLERLREAVAKDAAIRRVQRLQPVGGVGDKIFPPTYPGERRNDSPRHVFERRQIGGQNVLCVLIDSPQSQANRLEEALKVARDAGLLAFPAISVDFTDTDVADIGRITTLNAPHRVFDAIVRDSELRGICPFQRHRGRKTPGFRESTKCTRTVYELSPTALIFGAWNSTGEGGGLGAKFPRCVVSEIVGINVAVEDLIDVRSGVPHAKCCPQVSAPEAESIHSAFAAACRSTSYRTAIGRWSHRKIRRQKDGFQGSAAIRNQPLQHSPECHATRGERRLRTTCFRCCHSLHFDDCVLAAILVQHRLPMRQLRRLLPRLRWPLDLLRIVTAISFVRAVISFPKREHLGAR